MTATDERKAEVMRKGLHIIRALLPEDLDRKDCWWCGADARSRGAFAGYRPRTSGVERSQHLSLCFQCALKCSQLPEQPPVGLLMGDWSRLEV